MTRQQRRMIRVLGIVGTAGIAISFGAHGLTAGAATKTTKTIKKAANKAKSKSPSPGSTAAQSSRPKVTLPPDNPDVKRVEVSAWSVDKPLEGWDTVDGGAWPEPGKALGIVARASSIEVRRAPSVGAPGLLFVKGRSTTGPVTFLGLRDYGEWVQVLLPVRPNGTVGWVKGSQVSRMAIRHRVVVELNSNTLWVELDGQTISKYPVSSGTGGTPTPTGLFYARELVEQANASGPYGPYVFGLSGYSEVLNDFDGGEGAIGIHGTNRPDAIGDSVSHGCIRVTNTVISALTRTLPLGTPVEIVRSRSELPTTRRSMGEPDPIPETTTPSGIVIDFTLEAAPIPVKRLEDFDVNDVNDTGQA